LCTRLPNESSERVLLMLEKLGERREKLLAMLAMLSFRIIEFADARIWFSTLRFDMPGNGSMSFVHTSSSIVSSLMRSALRGARVGTWWEDMNDCDRVTTPGDNVGGESGSFCACVFLMMTWLVLVFAPRVAARCTDMRLTRLSACPKIGPRDLRSNDRDENMSCMVD
jgi:hypothetical protein